MSESSDNSSESEETVEEPIIHIENSTKSSQDIVELKKSIDENKGAKSSGDDSVMIIKMKEEIDVCRSVNSYFDEKISPFMTLEELLLQIEGVKSVYLQLAGLRHSYELIKNCLEKDDNGILRLAYKIKYLMNDKSLIGQKFSLEILKKMLPNAIQLIVWEEDIYLKNSDFRWFKYFLYADPDNVIKDRNSSAHRHTYGVVDKPDEGVVWKFKTKNDGQSFYLENGDLEEYLFAYEYDGALDGARFCLTSKIITDSDESDYRWHIECKDRGNKIILKNEYYGEYLHIGRDAPLGGKEQSFTPVDKKACSNAEWLVEKYYET